jgi:hypothetical protein
LYILNIKKLLSLFLLLISHCALSDLKVNDLNAVDSEVVYELTDLDQIRDALAKYSRAEDKNNAIYEEKRRLMLDSIEVRFLACDIDSDNTLDVFEVTQCLPQVARRFRDVDIDNDNVITLDEIALLAKTYKRNNKVESKNPIAKEKTNQAPAASLDTDAADKEL